MQDNRSTTITNALNKMPSRFELILVAARRAREIQNYEADLNKAKLKLRNTSTLAIAQARANSRPGSRENQIEHRIKELEDNPIVLFVEREENEKPTITALREIESGQVTKDYLDRQNQISQVSRDKDSFDEAEKLANSAELIYSYDDDEINEVDFSTDDDE